MTFSQKQAEIAAMDTATLIDRLENVHLFENEGGGLANAVEWVEFKARFRAVVEERNAMARDMGVPEITE